MCPQCESEAKGKPLKGICSCAKPKEGIEHKETVAQSQQIIDIADRNISRICDVLTGKHELPVDAEHYLVTRVAYWRMIKASAETMQTNITF
jgi:hypothetical protein